MQVAYALVVPAYALTGMVGFWAFGNAASANFSENLSDGKWLRCYLWLNAITTVPLVIINQVALFLNLELAIGLEPADVWKASTRNRWFSNTPPILVRLMLRGGYIVAMYVAARALVGAGLGPLTDIAGALGICALTYWLPYILHAKLFWDSYTYLQIVFAMLNVAFGFFVAVTGVFFAIRALNRQHAAIFKEDACLEGADFWGNSLWNRNLTPQHHAYKTIVVGCCHHGHTCGD